MKPMKMTSMDKARMRLSVLCGSGTVNEDAAINDEKVGDSYFLELKRLHITSKVAPGTLVC